MRSTRSALVESRLRRAGGGVNGGGRSRGGRDAIYAIGHTPRGGVALRRVVLAYVLGSALGVPAIAADAPGSRAEPAFSAEVGSPLWLSANLGLRLPLGGMDAGRGLLIQVQPGIGGGALNVGFVPLSFQAQGTQAIGVAVKARLLRTWGSPWGTDPGLTYGGFEVGVAIGVKLAGGLLWKVGSGPGGDRIWTWSVGLGL